jgi:endonuclease/exonuclease/phosphatase family metal-dependent hydrolase
MPTLRVASANLEWMNYWFTNDSDPVGWKTTFVQDGKTNNTAKTAKRAAAMIKAINPDILAVEEGPSREGELALFIKDHLADGSGNPIYKFFLSDSGGQQRVALLYKPAAVTSASLAPHPAITGLIDAWEADVDGDMHLEPDYQFTRNPLVVNFKLGAHDLQIIVLHTKSSFVNNGAAMWSNAVTRQDYVIAALKARRRNSTEGMRLRDYLDTQLAVDPTMAIIVLGDLNDGPGLDYFEKRYLAHNVTDVVIGSAFQPERVFGHAQHDVATNDRYTAVFDDFVEGITNKKLLLDHVMLSPGLLTTTGLRKVANSGTIHHAEYTAQVSAGGSKRENRPSDHRPVSVRVRY